MNNAVMFSKASDEWSTPLETFAALHEEFDFDVDAAAMRENKWLDAYFGPDHYFPGHRDALTFRWTGYGKMFWLNPPYSKCREFVAKAAEQAALGCTVVMLLPSRTDTRFWHDHIWNRETHEPYSGVQIRFIKGRLKFGGATAGAPFPSCVVVLRGIEL